MPSKYAGIGTQLALGTSSPPTQVVVQVGDISFGALTAGTYDTTTHDNSLSGYKDFITGLKDGGEVTFKVYFDAADSTHKDTAGGLVGLFNANSLTYFKITPAGYSPAVTWTGSGYITSIGAFTYPVDGVQACDVKFKVRGKPTLA